MRARISAWLMKALPKGLYARALIIMIAPIVLLESIVAFTFMERHWEAVTRRLSVATAQNISAVVKLYETYSADDDYRQLLDISRNKLKLSLQILPPGELPPPRPRPFFDILDRTLSEEIRQIVNREFWIDTVGQSRHVEIRIKLPDAILRFVTRRNQTYASNSHVFIVWMVVASVVLLLIAILFLSNQIRPILRLAAAADAFGKGRPVPSDFKPRGAREVRNAAHAFMEMRDRIEKHVEQRTTMLAGVSHDLRTILTRFKLQLAVIEWLPEAAAMRADVDEMQLMLEDYMAFARGDLGEEAQSVDVKALLDEICDAAVHLGKPIRLQFKRRNEIVVHLRRRAFKRAITNLISNAARYANHILITVSADRKWLRIEVEDDGPGIPGDKHEEVFRPFFRLESGRNQDHGNTGLGLSIARDITRGQGGDLWLEDSIMGGLKAVIRIPL